MLSALGLVLYELNKEGKVSLVVMYTTQINISYNEGLNAYVMVLRS